MPEFFLELLSEEIPARMQADASEAIRFAVEESFVKLGAPKMRAYFGPRRQAFLGEVAHQTQGNFVTLRGPKDGAAEVAINGFLQKHNTVKEMLVLERGHWWLRFPVEPIPASEFIKTSLEAVLTSKFWLKNMRWGQSGSFAWVRPLRRIICLLGGEVVPLKLGPLIASNKTEGHRAISPNTLIISGFADWKKKLYEAHVVVDQDSRAEIVSVLLSMSAEDLELTVVEDNDLINEVAGLVEWPVPLIGRIDEHFMSLPPEVRELSMKVNQKYFALRDNKGNPAPFFGFVTNLKAPDGGAAIIAGNERVLRARLSDARHFWDRDLRTPLNELLPKLDGIVFHAKIGTQLARAERIATLAAEIADMLGADESAAKQAAWAGLLCKADLVTGMVGEFPELQGIMGGYYAAKTSQGWDGAVVGPAIKSHYQPKGPSDAVPNGTVAVSVALADKIDTLVQFFRIGEVPTGSGDPYALRRAALGVIRIILENELRLPLRPLLGGDEKLFAFIIERLRVKLRGEGRRFDVLDGVLGAGTDDDLTRVMQRVDAVSAFLAGPDGANLIVAYRRAANILRIEDAKDGPHRGADLQRLSGSAEETDFANALAEVQTQTVEDFLTGRYDAAMTALARLRAPVDAFFDKVTVNAPEPELRLNRLRLLALLRDTMNQIADFSRVET